jgi:hypothetical protein
MVHEIMAQTNPLDGISMIAPRGIACNSDSVCAKNKESDCGGGGDHGWTAMWLAVCNRTDVLDHRIEVYNGRAGAGMQSSGQTSGACIEFDHARFRLSSCEGKAKDDVKALQGSKV